MQISLLIIQETAFSNSTLPSLSAWLNDTSILEATSTSNATCSSLHAAYWESLNSFHISLDGANKAGKITLSVSTISTAATSVGYSSIPYTLEDAYPRLKLIPTSTNIKWSTTLSYIYPNFTKALPNCDIRAEGDCGKCTLYAQDVQLNYWPIETHSGHSNFKVTSTGTDPVTAVVDGTTFTSPTIYLSYRSVFAEDRCIYVSHSNVLIGISSDHLSSLAIYSGQTPHSFNFADLNGPVPASVWLAQLMCQPTTDCFPIRDDYRPWLAVPNEIRTVDPAWKDCELTYLGSFDPPRILVPAQVLASPTSPPNTDVLSTKIVPAASPLPPVSATTRSYATSSPTALKPLNLNPADNKPIEEPPARVPPVQGPPHWSPTRASIDLTLGGPAYKHDPHDTQGHSNGRDAAIFTLGSQVYTVISSKYFLIGSSTLSFGGPAAKVSDQMISLHTMGVFVGSIMHPFSAAKTPVMIDVAKLYTAKGKKFILIASSTLSAGGDGTIAGQVISVGANELIVNGKTISYSMFQEAGYSDSLMLGGQSYIPAGFYSIEETFPISTFAAAFHASTTSENGLLSAITIGAQIFTADAAHRYLIDDQTLTPGGTITARGTTMTLAASASAAPASTTIDADILTMEAQTFAADSMNRYQFTHHHRKRRDCDQK